MMRRLAILAVIGAAVPALADPGRPRVAEAQPTGSVSAVLYTNRVQWRTAPGTAVSARLTGDSGVKAVGNAVADDEGRVSITLRPARFGGPRGPGQPGQPGRPNFDFYLRPGDRLNLAEVDTQGITVTIPSLAVDVDPTANLVVGMAPPGASLSAEIASGGAVFTTTLAADAGGSFAWDLAGTATVVSGDAGFVSFTDPDGHTFGALFAAFGADITIGGRSVSGTATLGNEAGITVVAQDGSRKFNVDGEILGDTSFQVPGGGRFSARRPPIVVGDEVGIRYTSDVLGPTVAVSITVPAISIVMNQGADEVSGEAPAGAALTVTAMSPRDEVFARAATVGADGTFRVSFAGDADLGAGWRAMAAVEMAPGVRVRAIDAVPQVRAQVQGSLVQGVGVPGAPITITLSTAADELKAQEVRRINNSGAYRIDLTDAVDDVRIEPTDILEVEFSAGDPVLLPVPEVTATTDPASDTVSGLAPGGRKVWVTGGLGPDAPVLETTALADDTFTVDFSGVVDIERPMMGEVAVQAAGGHEFFMNWSAVQLRVVIGSSFLSGNGPAGRQADIRVQDFSGREVAAGSDTVAQIGGFGGPFRFGGQDNSLPRWFVRLLDVTSQPVAVQASDMIRADVGDDVITLEVPPLSGVARIADDSVSGQTNPGFEVDIVVQRPLTGDTTRVSVVADERGIFAHDFEDFDLQYNDFVSLTTTVDGHIVTSNSIVPGLRFNLDSAALDGSWEPLVAVTAELVGPAGRRAFGAATADDRALFEVDFVDAGGQPVEPAVGDEVRVYTGDPDRPVLSMTVPELSLDWDSEARRIMGRATFGGLLQVNLMEGFIELGPGGGFAAVQPDIAPDNTYSAEIPRNVELDPGTRLLGIYRLPVGHIAIRNSAVPLVNVQHGGNNVCGVAPPRARVDAELLNGGAPVAAGSATARTNTQYSLRLADGAGAPAAAAAGQTVRATVNGTAYEVTLPELTLDVDWAQGIVTGQGPPRRRVSVFVPATNCLGPANRDFTSASVTRTRSDGSFTLNPSAMDPGDGFEISFELESGHRFYRDVFRSLGQVFVRTRRLTGRANPLSAVSAVLLAADGTEKAQAQGRADGEGYFDLEFPGAASEPGDTVRLSASGENPEIVVEDLSFDFSDASGVTGSGPPNRAVQIDLELTDGRVLHVEQTTSGLGVFQFGQRDIPPRANWTFADVVRVRVILPTPNGHQIVSEVVLDRPEPTPPPTPPPPEDRPRIFLPWTGNSAAVTTDGGAAVR